MITDESNQAIEDATIKVNGVTTSTKTDSSGQWMSPESYKAKTELTIEASKSGFESNESFKMVIKSDETLNRATIKLSSTSVKFSSFFLNQEMLMKESNFSVYNTSEGER